MKEKVHDNNISKKDRSYVKQVVDSEGKRTDYKVTHTTKPIRLKKPRPYYDYSLFFAVVFIFAIGLIVIYSSSGYIALKEKEDAGFYFKKQLIIGSFGLIFAFIFSHFDYRKLRGIISLLIYGVGLALALYALIGGLASHGKLRWVVIFGQNLQPAEVVKIGLILVLATIVSNASTDINEKKYWKKALFFSLLPAFLILTQNLSSGAIIIFIAAVMLFVAMDKVAIFAGLGGGFVGLILLLKPLMHTIILRTGYTKRPEKYYLRRILAWAAPEVFETDAYQTMQGMYAIGSGGILGHGLGESLQKFGKVPELQNDMIFTIICEEFGFVGAAAIIILYIYILVRIYKIALNAPDMFGTMICTGVMAHIGIQTALNIAVVTAVIPNTGVTLPFISYGGTAILITMVEIGLVLSVAHRIKVR